jgi:hypothetical protein
MGCQSLGRWVFGHAEYNQGGAQNNQYGCRQKKEWSENNPDAKEHCANDGACRRNTAANENEPD